MRDIVYIRLDDRLVHGQIVAVWLNDMKCDVLCVIDDKAATNSLQQMLLRMAVPKSTNFELLTVEEGAKYLLEEIDEKIFLIVGEIETITRLVDLGVPIKEVNLETSVTVAIENNIQKLYGYLILKNKKSKSW